jgi:parvulin-like peptidyl-prolyl isomerase
VGAKKGQTGKLAGRKRLALIVFGAVFVLLFAGFAIAQGLTQPSVPSGAVATVSNVPDAIANPSEADFRTTLISQVTAGGLKKTPKPGTSKYEELKTKAMGELLQQVWLFGEAEELGISVTAKQIAEELATIKKQNFKTPTAYKEFLKQSHFTQADVNERVKLQIIENQIQEMVQGETPPPSSSEIQAYYEAEEATQFTEKASRDVRVIVNEDKSKVEAAKKELEKDHSEKAWKKVAPKYSSDPTTKETGGLQKGITEEFVQGELKSAIFGSATGELVGPVKFEKNYLLLEVVNLNPEKVKTLAEVKSQISSTLQQEQQQEHFSEFFSAFESKWESRTVCASGFVVERCSNYEGTGHPATASPACYEANPKTPAKECPAPVLQNSPALPGTVTVLKPKGEPFPQRSQPEASATGEATSLPEGATTAEPPTAE